MTHTVYLPTVSNPDVPPTPAETVIGLLNEYRQANGRATLQQWPGLMWAAEDGAKWLVTAPEFRHDPEWANRVWRRCPACYRIGENIAGGYPTPEAVMQGWIDSPPHRDNMLDSRYLYVGVGYAPGGFYRHYWCINFGGAS